MTTASTDHRRQHLLATPARRTLSRCWRQLKRLEREVRTLEHRQRGLDLLEHIAADDVFNLFPVIDEQAMEFDRCISQACSAAGYLNEALRIAAPIEELQGITQ